MNIGVIFTTPNLSFVDVQARKLFHNYMETSFIDYEESLAYLKIYNIQHNSRFDKTYYKAPRFRLNGRLHRCPFIVLPKPRSELVQEYEEVKNAYTEKLNAEALRELTKPSGIQKKSLDLEQVKKDIIENKGKYLKEYNKHKFIDYELIKTDFKLGYSAAKSIKKTVEKEIL